MPRHENQNTTALRSALMSDLPRLKRAAESIIRSAWQAPTVGEAADRMGIPRRALERLRELRPDLFE
jgi:hypothetical protein